MFTLAISCSTTSNLPWFMDLTFQVPMQYCSLQHQTLFPSPVTYTTGHLFLLWLSLFILSGAISSLFCSSILGPYWPGEFTYQCHVFLPFHTVHGVLKARTRKWSAIPFSSGPHLVSASEIHQATCRWNMLITCKCWVEEAFDSLRDLVSEWKLPVPFHLQKMPAPLMVMTSNHSYGVRTRSHRTQRANFSYFFTWLPKRHFF